MRRRPVSLERPRRTRWHSSCPATAEKTVVRGPGPPSVQLLRNSPHGPTDWNCCSVRTDPDNASATGPQFSPQWSGGVSILRRRVRTAIAALASIAITHDCRDGAMKWRRRSCFSQTIVRNSEWIRSESKAIDIEVSIIYDSLFNLVPIY